MPEGIVTRVVANFFDVTDGREMRRCQARGVFRKRKTKVLVGDRVTYDPIGSAEGIVTEVLPRKTELVRPPVANVDQALLVFSLVSPDFLPGLLDRLLVSVAHAGLSAAIVLTKCDLADAQTVSDKMDPYRKAGYPVFAVVSPQQQGLDAVRAALAGKVTVFAGPSGAGKSTLANALSPELGVKMGEVSEKVGRGKHTTRHVELFELEPNTFIVDAPGFSQLEVQVDSQDLRLYFPEFSEWTQGCLYRSCLHVQEDQCAVKEAVEKRQVSRDRYESYCEMYAHIRQKEENKY
ncbi:ribosome small subunit-dependent GTPase A [Alicyclobacillus tolerans]|uniref:ribosome small subunit-dependent GTPase A n=1 Tax=Alicyclobacillus tolerans TaxID=90970 RepID=UPI001F00BA23|nr:ribosome small subunit-dependent GTPase A [Alicyclobacillus tolerans]MCF8564420.1 ribosome small subunit-dependent GTPase A [Alicyclobacillus tolerans]